MPAYHGFFTFRWNELTVEVIQGVFFIISKKGIASYKSIWAFSKSLATICAITVVFIFFIFPVCIGLFFAFLEEVSDSFGKPRTVLNAKSSIEETLGQTELRALRNIRVGTQQCQGLCAEILVSP